MNTWVVYPNVAGSRNAENDTNSDTSRTKYNKKSLFQVCFKKIASVKLQMRENMVFRLF